MAGCESAGNAIISVVPTFEAGAPPIAEKEFDKKAKEMLQKSNGGIIYVSMGGKLEKCGNADVWIDDIYIGRVFLSTYIFYPASGRHTVKIQDERINVDSEEIYFHTTSFEVTIDPSEKYLITISPEMENCAFYQNYCAQFCAIKKYSELELHLIQDRSDLALLDGKHLSRLNEFDAKERGMWNREVNGQRVFLNQFAREDLCDGRATPNWRPTPSSWTYLCSYEHMNIVKAKK